MNEVVNEEQMIDAKTYWNDYYWGSHLEEHKEELDFLNDIWLDKYNDILNGIPKGNALDLGCGIGQYTKYLMDKGFNVTALDISKKALKVLKEGIPTATVMEKDMVEPLPFPDKSFSLVLANLSINYFDSVTTAKMMKEIHRLLPKSAYLIGSVNSAKSTKQLELVAVELEPFYYYENGRHVRLFDEEQLEYFFKDFEFLILKEITVVRWGKEKVLWEFIAKSK